MMEGSSPEPVDVTDLPLSEKLKNGYNPMIEGVRWTERYATQIERIWNHIPNLLRQTIIFVSIFLLASSIQGDIIISFKLIIKRVRIRNKIYCYELRMNLFVLCFVRKIRNYFLVWLKRSRAKQFHQSFQKQFILHIFIDWTDIN